MIQELFSIGPISISPYGVMLVLAFLAAYFQLAWGMKRLGAGDSEDASSIVLWGGLAGLVGAKIYYAALNGDWSLLFDRAGLVWYGAFIGGILAVSWVLYRRRLPFGTTFDAIAPAAALGYGIGRIGCFLVGDDYGIPTDRPWGVVFANGLPPTEARYLREHFDIALPADMPPDTLVAVHPTQLYETGLALLIWGVGIWLLKRRRQVSGMVALSVFSLMALERFGIEFLRAKDDRIFGDFTLAQAISLLILVFLGVLALVRMRRQRRERGNIAEQAAPAEG
jgi:phosphatidylglycerol---prolipoprotein diacylglyceryl transferase